MAHDVAARFHDTWLGEVQPSQGLTFSVPVLCDGSVMVKLGPAEAARFYELVAAPEGEAEETAAEGAEARPAVVRSLRGLLVGFLGWTEEELSEGGALPEALVLRLADEGTELRPSFAIARSSGGTGAGASAGAGARAGEEGGAGAGGVSEGEETPATRAGRAYQLLAWEVPPGLSLDDAESETNAWHYPPTAKLERLLRETRVPMGLLCNGHTVRLLYCPHGQSTGWVSFPVGYMAGAQGRDVLSAFRELLHADRVMGGMPGTPTTLELLEQSRDRQADVTTRLGQQLLDALQVLLQGFEAAARRDGDDVLREAMREEGNHVYEGLLTVMLRLVFSLYAEDRGLVPSEHAVYAEHLGVIGLHDRLQADADAYGDTMEQRFGAWPRLVMLFRALYFGLRHGSLVIPPHRGRLFDPERYAFLEGRMPGGAAPVGAEDRAAVRLPSVSDGVVLRVLRRLSWLDGQRLSYQALEEEQLGSVYEGLMGYAVERRAHGSVCLRPSRVWVSPEDLLEQPAATRERWLGDGGVAASACKQIAKAVAELEKEHAGGKEREREALREAVMEVLRGHAAGARRRGRGAGGGGGGGGAGGGGPWEDEGIAAEVEAGRLVVQPGEERRRTSSHYTPRSLSGPIVRRTLEPLLAAMRARMKQQAPEVEDPQPSSAMILRLKVCDPAMGSGAFLVESCRFLADQLVAAWVREGVLDAVLREAAGGAGGGAEDGVARDPVQLARRMVAQQCLYGVDKNPLAVELGKLSLWLLTLARGQTFTFLDHCLKAGDSLVGLSRGQILAMGWDEDGAGAGEKGKKAKAKADEGGKAAKGAKAGKGKKAGKSKESAAGAAYQIDLFAEQTRRAFEKAGRAREKLGALARSGDRSATEREQRELHVEAEREIERLRDVADVVLSAWFWPDGSRLEREWLFEGKKASEKERGACLRRLRDELNFWLQDAEAGPLKGELALRRELVREGIRPMHWELEFPEVFWEERTETLAVDGSAGAVWMDAVVGNPPFAGKNGITATGGAAYLEWLTSAYVPSHGNADLSAYFFRRARWLLGAHGTFGLIATNTIGQGDTRTTGLQAIVAGGGKIYDATQNLKWPVPGANVSVSVVHVAVGMAAGRNLKPHLDGLATDSINSQLRPTPERRDPSRLTRNAGKGFQGTIVLGKGFLLTPAERDALLASSKKNGERILPYIGGEEINTSPTQDADRFVINFEEMDLPKAESWPNLISILRSKVKPERDNAKHSKRPWWLFERPRHELYQAVRSLPRCLATARVTKHLIMSFQPVDRIFSEQLIVFPLPDYAHFGLLQSRIHERWARLQGSSMRNDLRYTPSDCFETFPFPPAPTLASSSPLEAIAKRLYETRAAFMVATDQGLTKTYNALKDPADTRPEIEELRRLHVELDRAVLDAYGHPEIEVPPYVGATEEQLERFEDAVLDFLFAENERQAKEEARAKARASS